MEYLMTYGWAILIIAVVLGVLYYLGVFNTSNLAPRLQPGSCHVARTSAGVENFGVCAGLPEFVAEFNNPVNTSTPQDYIDILNPGPSYFTSNAFTVSMWANVQKDNIAYPKEPIFSMGCGSFFQVNFGYWHVPSSRLFDFYVGPDNAELRTSSPISLNEWYNIIGTYDSGNFVMYVNGQAVNSSTGSGTSLSSDTSGTVGIGDEGGCAANFIGYISNAQIYNASLSAAEAKALYMEGIGGAPVIPQSIVGWWPLNGNAADYSGNNNNGQSVNVQYTNTWINSYSAP